MQPVEIGAKVERLHLAMAVRTERGSIVDDVRSAFGKMQDVMALLRRPDVARLAARDRQPLRAILNIGRDAETAFGSASKAWSEGRPIAPAEAAYEGGGHIARLANFLAGNSISREQRAAVHRIRAELSALEREYANFQRETAMMKEQLLARQSHALGQFIEVRAAIEQSRLIITMRFQDILRRSYEGNARLTR